MNYRTHLESIRQRAALDVLPPTGRCALVRKHGLKAKGLSLLHFRLDQTTYSGGLLHEVKTRPVDCLLQCRASNLYHGNKCPPAVCMWLFRHAFCTSHDPRLRDGAIHELLVLGETATLLWKPTLTILSTYFFQILSTMRITSQMV